MCSSDLGAPWPGPAMADIALVTGASGFVGSAVARALGARGLHVRVLMRATASRKNIADLDCEPVEGDMRDEVSMTTAMRGARYFFHVAADYRLWAPDPGEIERNNLLGARATMNAALTCGVERVVYTSSVAALKPGETAVDETSRHTPQSVIGAYKRSKLVAEREVERLIRDRNLPAVIVAPSTPIGPRDIKPTPTGRIIVEAATGRMPALKQAVSATTVSSTVPIWNIARSPGSFTVAASSHTTSPCCASATMARPSSALRPGSPSHAGATSISSRPETNAATSLAASERTVASSTSAASDAVSAFAAAPFSTPMPFKDRKSTRLNSSHT